LRLRRPTQSGFLANGFSPSAISLPNFLPLHFFVDPQLPPKNRSSGRNAGKVVRSTAKATPGAGWLLALGGITHAASRKHGIGVRCPRWASWLWRFIMLPVWRPSTRRWLLRGKNFSAGLPVVSTRGPGQLFLQRAPVVSQRVARAHIISHFAHSQRGRGFFPACVVTTAVCDRPSF
jgi:hypothetical protein